MPRFKEWFASLRKRILDGFYRNGKITYDPVTDFQLTKVQVHNLKKNECPLIPLMLIEPEWKVKKESNRTQIDRSFKFNHLVKDIALFHWLTVCGP